MIQLCEEWQRIAKKRKYKAAILYILLRIIIISIYGVSPASGIRNNNKSNNSSFGTSTDGWKSTWKQWMDGRSYLLLFDDDDDDDDDDDNNNNYSSSSSSRRMDHEAVATVTISITAGSSSRIKNKNYNNLCIYFSIVSVVKILSNNRYYRHFFT